MNRFAVLQLSGCAGCEVSLLNAGEWMDRFQLVYMPLVVSAYDVPPVDLLLVSGGVRTDEDLYKLRRATRDATRDATRGAAQIIAIGTCAISGGVASLGDRDDVRDLFMRESVRRHVPRLLPRCHPIDAFVDVDRYLPGCPPTPQLFMALLNDDDTFKPARIVCRECGRKKVRDLRPKELRGFQQGQVLPDICLVNQGYLCIGTSTRGGCGAPCPQAGHPCVGCRGPSDALIDKESDAWFTSIKRVFASMTDIPDREIDVALRSPQLSLFLFQFSDYAAQVHAIPGLPERERAPRTKEKML
jgi:F420-non-reducing hydrogenase small subunit